MGNCPKKPKSLHEGDEDDPNQVSWAHHRDFEIQPPHQLVHEDIEEISKTYRFFVKISGIKCRNLKNAECCFAVVNWDDYSFEKRTRPQKMGNSPKFPDVFQFTWTAPSLRGMEDKLLDVSIWEDDKAQGVLLGSVSVPLYKIATGPVHHDFRLNSPSSKGNQKGEDGSRVIFDVQMSQICQLIINPVEILVHLHGHMQEEEEEVVTKSLDDPNEPVAAPTVEGGQICEDDDTELFEAEWMLQFEPTGVEGDQTYQSMWTEKCVEPYWSAINEASIHEQRVSLFASPPTSPTAPNKPAQSIPSVAAAFAARAPSFRTATIHETPSTTTATGANAAAQNGIAPPASQSAPRLVPLPQNLPSPPKKTVSIVEQKDSKESEAPQDLLDDGASAEIPAKSTPGTVNKFNVRLRGDTTQTTTDAGMTAQSLPDPVQHPLPPDQPGEQLKVKGVDMQQQQSHTPQTPQTPPLEANRRMLRIEPISTNLRAVASAPRGHPSLVPSKALSRGSPEKATVPNTDNNLPPAPNTPHQAPQNPGSGNHVPGIQTANGTGQSTSPLPGQQAQGGVFEVPHPVLSASPSPSFTAPAPPQHLDRQNTYRRLASIVKEKKTLARELLLDNLPTIQLETTVEQLRQQHINVHLYMRVLGMSAPKLFGEIWIPFYKLYDADVVESMDKHFFDCYFHERIWSYGKCIGYLEGIILFQNNPAVAQAVAGVLTEEGPKRISPPVLGAEHKTVNFFFRNQDIVPNEIKQVTETHQRLLDTLWEKRRDAGDTAAQREDATLVGREKTRGSEKTPAGRAGDLNSLCETLLQVLKKSQTETRKSYIYKSEAALLTGQRVLLNVANHVLEYLDYILYVQKAQYCAILHQVLRRGELDVGTCMPEPPEPLSKQNAALKEVLACYKKIKEEMKASREGASRKKKREKEKEATAAVKNSGTRGSSVSDASEVAPVRGSVSPNGGEKKPSRLLFPTPGQEKPSDENSTKKDVDADLAAPVPPERVEALVGNLTEAEKLAVMLYHKRMKLCRQYLLLLYRMLYYALDKLSNDAVFEGQKKYLSIFLCIAYFRIPAFRKGLLEGVLNGRERKLAVDEWRGTEYHLDEASLIRMEHWHPSSSLRSVLDWTHFHNNLLGYFGYKSLQTALEDLPIPKSDNWRERLCKRSTAFFSFLEHWAKHVYQVVPNKEALRWHHIPGYAHLLKGMLIEMKQRDVTRYPDSLLNCTGAMLANEKLLSVFIKILFLKTSAYHPPSVFSAMNYLDYWVQVLSLRGLPLPPNFDFHFLLKGLDILLGCEMCLNVSKGLWFIYKNVSIFQGTRLRSVVNDLLIEKYFFTLFLNWSWLVRKCFMWFLLYRVCEGARQAMMRGVPKRKLSLDERTWLEAYSRLCQYFEKIGAPAVFPQQTLEAALNREEKAEGETEREGEQSATTKGQKTGDHGSRAGSKFAGFRNIGNLASQAEINQDKKEMPPTPSALTMKREGSAQSEVMTEDITGASPWKPRLLDDTEEDDHADSEQMPAVGGRRRSFSADGDELRREQSKEKKTESGRNAKYRADWAKALSRRDEPKEVPEAPQDMKIYIASASPEFSRELAFYRDWVIGGADQLPTMHIPATPLDQGVDVPLESW
uniref:C2 domain-containing protein n=1 Tax=Chromera velia CCMP2878 TaxID=1169474 RepID=A0A0G4GQ96_9ALVE|eukprot:Cvel_734.t1-p1 / transcript=Cvel_734.t1 / gene=Cvel_734 / organism=Chromera_velia_CCMP2878 / gene_product=hypothetical protein / transcript_product=hypothetical protein / location=Cvel_scaffold22:174613-192787(+) / protein_length=1613 / sequence_SO=supercontig / SO=protein_coding / is_pseudo=false